MGYSVALQVAASPPWRWQSTALSSLTLVIRWLQFYRVLPCERLRIFAAGSREALNEQLLRENQGLPSSSVPARQFLHERGLAPPGRRRETAAAPTCAPAGTASVNAVTKPAQGESRSSPTFPAQGTVRRRGRRRS